MAAAATITGRSTSTFARTILRVTPSRTAPATATRTRPVTSNFSLPRQPRKFPTLSSSRLVRRELSTLVPVHSAISAACLVSRLPSEAGSSLEGRFANYLSPI